LVLSFRSTRWLSIALLVGGLAVAAADCGGSSKPPATPMCVLDSDCAGTLNCVQGFCVHACNQSKDCPSGERCIVVTIGDAMGNACEPPEKSVCHFNSQCEDPLVCAADQQCRNECMTDKDCPMGQKCTSISMLCADPTLDSNYDPVTNEFRTTSADGGVNDGGGSDVPLDGNPNGGDGPATGGDGPATGGDARDGGADGPPVNSCPNAQTQFGDIAMGDGNPNFNSGVGVRGPDQMLVFSGYQGPLPAALDGGTDPDAGGTTANAVYVQAFDVASAASLGPAVPLFQVPDGMVWGISDASIAPTGEIVILYNRSDPAGGPQVALYATFFAPVTPADGGAPSLQVKRTVQLESVQLTNPHVAWSVTSQAFVFSWRYYTSAWFVRVRKFLTDGRGAGGDTNAVPAPSLDNRWVQGSVGTSGSLFGVATVNNATYHPFLTLLDADGNQVGTSIEVAPMALGNGQDVLTVGGTANGFLEMFRTNTTATAFFIPTTGASSVLADAGAPPDGGDGGGPPPFASFSFPSSMTDAQSISDDTGGAGGVGVAMLEPNGAAFLYMTADGGKHVNGGTVISSSAGAEIAITNYHGSFSLSLYDKNTHATQVAASGCN
jgi:hypothetical protein